MQCRIAQFFLCAHAIGMEKKKKKKEMSPLAAAYQIIVKINYAAVNCPDAVTIINRLRNDSRLRVALRRARGVGVEGVGSHADSAEQQINQIASFFFFHVTPQWLRGRLNFNQVNGALTRESKREPLGLMSTFVFCRIHLPNSHSNTVRRCKIN